MFFTVLLAAYLYTALPGRFGATLEARQTHLRALSAALIEYSIDHSGNYPDHLTQLQPRYFQSDFLPHLEYEAYNEIKFYGRPSFDLRFSDYDDPYLLVTETGCAWSNRGSPVCCPRTQPETD